MQYISNTDSDKKAILQTLGAENFETLLKDIPSSLRNFKWDLPTGISEVELMRDFVEIGRQNRHFEDYACYLGAGVYDHFVPAAVNALATRGEFITSYTPYQGEASQGTLQSIYEYQSLICELTGMDYSNASMYDGASALAEAALLSIRHTGRRKIIVPVTVHPEYRAVVKTYVSCLDALVVEVPMATDGGLDLTALIEQLDKDTACVIAQQPNFFGLLEDMKLVAEAAHKVGALFIACVNPVSLGILEPPGAYGADIAVGEGQPLGNDVSFGGPHFGFFTVQKDLLRKMPGRIAGMTVDKQGRRCFVLTLQAREQHIRREKATSNICTNHSLCALKGAIYLTLLGKKGLKKLALLNVENAHATYEDLLKVPGVRAFSKRPFFNEFALWIEKDAALLKKGMEGEKLIGPLSLSSLYPAMQSAYLFAVTETRTPQQMNRLVKAVSE